MQLDELNELAAEVRAKEHECEHCVRVCMAAGCQSSGAAEVLEVAQGEGGGYTSTCA